MAYAPEAQGQRQRPGMLRLGWAGDDGGLWETLRTICASRQQEELWDAPGLNLE